MHVLRSTLLVSAALLGASARAQTPQLVLEHGHIFTGDPAAPWAEALLVEGDRIAAVGSDEAVAELTSEGASIIDLGGRAVIPGINDAHVHVAVPLGAYLNLPTFVPGPGPTLAETLGMLAGGAAATPLGTWLFAFVGTGVSEDPDAERFALDAVTPDHPVVLFAWSGHGMWLDTEALSALGISEEEPDPFGGFWKRYDGTPTVTGEAHEYAEFRVR